ncbi:isocitrate/isopropylmalate dehydrogenase family protein [candidate division KSB1 bacterium]|nr:isocitrate/isopropylmalate dehydrogenase family protein [candidate division KSB1 bacterium]
MSEIVEQAKAHFAALVEHQLERVEHLKQASEWIDYSRIRPIRIGFAWGDGIGPLISRETQRVLEVVLQEELQSNRLQFKTIKGFTIENRVRHLKAIPDDVLEELKLCHVILKAPLTTPEKGGPYPNIESGNVALRRELDLFANVRPVKAPSEGIDWTFFRENTEGAYILGSQGIQLTPDLAIDFTAVTRQGSERILQMAFAFAAKNRKRLTVVTKANVIKTTDGLFLESAERISRDYPQVEWDSWYIDIMTAKLLDPKRRRQFQVLVMPNLYGDILTDEAAEFQGGVGTAGSANIGKRYAMFEAIHGSAPRMIQEGRGAYADPSSLIRAAVLMLDHIGLGAKARLLEMAIEICSLYERKVCITGRDDGATGCEFCDYLLETIQDSDLENRWRDYSFRSNS